MSRQQTVVDSAATQDAQERVWDAFRRCGYLQASLDPLGDMAPVAMPELEVTGTEAEAARRVYCGTIGVEFMHIPERERREWIQARMEMDVPEADRARILDWLVRAEIFEQVLQTRYLGTKRYSLEGEAALLPLLDAILNASSEQGAMQAVLAMSHRGRLNVMVHVVGRGAAEVFRAFRGCGSAQRAGRRRCEISHGRDRRICDSERKKSGDSPGFESEPSGGGGSGGHRAHTSETDATRRRRVAANGASDRCTGTRRSRGKAFGRRR